MADAGGWSEVGAGEMQHKYQLMPELSQEEYAELEADILRRGVQVPIEFDEEGNVLDGFHRLEICQKHGLSYPSVVRRGMTEEEKIEHTLALNLARRHLSPEQRRELVAELRQRQWSTTRIAKALGVSHVTALRDLSACTNVQGEPAGRIIGNDGKSYPAKRPARNDALRKSPLLSGQYDVDIRQGDFRVVLNDIEPQSVKVILTDPPYGKEWLPLWDDLGAFAARVLRADGALIAYSGQFYLPQIMAMLGKHLEWWWLCGVAHRGPGNLTPLGHPVRLVVNQFKPLLVYVPRNGRGIESAFRDLIEGEGSEKEKHNWQQPVAEAKHILEMFCKEGDLVVDPFAGSGAFGEAARQLGLPFVGAEVLAVSEGLE